MVKNNNSLIRESFPNVVKFFFPYKKQTKSDVIKTVIFCKSAKNRKNNENSQMIKNENRVDSLEELYNFIQSDETKTRKKAYKVKRNKNSDQEEVKHDEDRVVKEFKDFLSHTTVRAKDCKKIVAVFTDDWLNNYK